MDLVELSKLDIKDLKKVDYKKLLQDIQKKPELAVGLLIGVAAVAVCLHLFSRAGVEGQSLRAEIKKIEEKIKAIADYNSTQEEFNQFLANLPEKITENTLIEKLTDFAAARNIQIESFSPAKSQSDAFYDLTGVVIDITAKEYKDVWLFVHDVENSKYAIRIDTWAGSMGPRSQGAMRRRGETAAPDDLWLNVRLEIAAVNFKQ